MILVRIILTVILLTYVVAEAGWAVTTAIVLLTIANEGAALSIRQIKRTLKNHQVL